MSDEKAKKCAVDVLKNCAAHYINPEFFRPATPQDAIDMAISNATKIVEAYAAYRVAQALGKRKPRTR